MQRSCPCATEARSQGDGVMVHSLRVQLAALHCIHAIYFLIQLQHIRLKQNIKLGDILIPQKAPSKMVTRNLFEV